MMLEQLSASLSKTHTDDNRFNQFALSILGKNYSNNEAQNLRAELLQQDKYWVEYLSRNSHSVEFGFGRIDALNSIYNDVTGLLLNQPGNVVPPDAPVSFPFLWGTGQSDWVQWKGVAYVRVNVLSVLRNVSEQCGIFAKVDVKPGTFAFESSMDLPQTISFMSLVDKLRSPVWPTGVLPAPDLDKAIKGKSTYLQRCANCHALRPHAIQDEQYSAVLVPVHNVNTDASAAATAIRYVKSGELAGERLVPLIGPRLKETDTAFNVMTRVAMGIAWEQFTTVFVDQLNFNTIKGLGTYIFHWGANLQPPKMLYKARPLDGIWATAPYLHNGSIPNLQQLLTNENQRSAEFYVGCAEYDPVNVGFMQPDREKIRQDKMLQVSSACLDDPALTSKLDTRIRGNYNTGHSGPAYGTDLTKSERHNLLEYLKTL